VSERIAEEPVCNHTGDVYGVSMRGSGEGKRERTGEQVALRGRRTRN